LSFFSSSPIGQDFSSWHWTRDLASSSPFWLETVPFSDGSEEPSSSIKPTRRLVPPLPKSGWKLSKSNEVLTCRLRGTYWLCQFDSKLSCTPQKASQENSEERLSGIPYLADPNRSNLVSNWVCHIQRKTPVIPQLESLRTSEEINCQAQDNNPSYENQEIHHIKPNKIFESTHLPFSSPSGLKTLSEIGVGKN
jgi:hypothetical protein